MIRHIQPRAIPKSEAPFSQVVLDDDFAYLSGLVAADFPEGQAELGDVGKETRAVLGAIGRILEEIGIDVGRIVRVDVHLTSLDDFDAGRSPLCGAKGVAYQAAETLLLRRDIGRLDRDGQGFQGIPNGPLEDRRL